MIIGELQLQSMNMGPLAVLNSFEQESTVWFVVFFTCGTEMFRFYHLIILCFKPIFTFLGFQFHENRLAKAIISLDTTDNAC